MALELLEVRARQRSVAGRADQAASSVKAREAGRVTARVSGDTRAADAPLATGDARVGERVETDDAEEAVGSVDVG